MKATIGQNLNSIIRDLHGGINSKCTQEENGHLQLHPKWENTGQLKKVSYPG